MDIVVLAYLIGISVLLYLIYQKYREVMLIRSVKKENCTSCRSVSISDGVLSEEECQNILRGDRVALKKLGGKTSVRKREEGELPSELVGDLVFLNESYSGGEVRSDGQIIYPLIGRRVKGKVILQPVRNGEQWVVVVGK